MDETLNEQNPTTVSEPAEIYLEASVLARGTTSQELKQAVALFESIPDYLDSRQQAANIQQQFLSLRKDEQSAQFSAFFYKAKNWLLYGGITAAALIILSMATILIWSSVKNNNLYNKAVQLMAEEKYEEAIGILDQLDDYRDAPALLVLAHESWQQQLLDADYDAAMALSEAGDYEAAILAFQALGSHKDSAHQLEIAQALLQAQQEEQQRSKIYTSAIELLDSGIDEKENEAYTLLSQLGQYKDVPQLLQKFQQLPCTTTFSDYNATTVDYTYHYTYDEYGRIATEQWTPSDSASKSQTSIQTYTYDANGRKVSASYSYPHLASYLYAPETIVSAEYIYDAGGRLIHCRKLSRSGVYYHDYYRWYDAEGNLLSTELSDEYLLSQANHTWVSVLENRMIDSEGKLLRTWAQNVSADGRLSAGWGKDTFYEYDESGRMSQKLFYYGSSLNEDVAIKTLYSYDSAGKLNWEKETTYIPGYGESTSAAGHSETVYTYDYDYDLLLSSKLYKDSTLNSTTEYQYLWVYIPSGK